MTPLGIFNSFDRPIGTVSHIVPILSTSVALDVSLAHSLSFASVFASFLAFPFLFAMARWLLSIALTTIPIAFALAIVPTSFDHSVENPNIEPSRFLLMDWEVRGNLENGNYILKILGSKSDQKHILYLTDPV